MSLPMSFETAASTMSAESLETRASLMSVVASIALSRATSIASTGERASVVSERTIVSIPASSPRTGSSGKSVSQSSRPQVCAAVHRIRSDADRQR